MVDVFLLGGGECQALRHEIEMHESERAVGEEICGRINISCIFGAEAKGCVREAMRGDMRDGGGENG